VLESVFPGLKDSEKNAVAERRRIGDGLAARHYVRGGGLTQGVNLHFCEHCNPVPGDRIVGIVEADKGITVHAIDCLTLAALEDQEDLWRDLHWTPEAEANTLSHARLKATIRDAVGVLGLVCTIIGEAGGNIINLNMHHRHSDFFDVDFDIEVRDAKHLTHIAAALRACPSIETVDRIRG
jgi:GTP pyrophosphokinase/guanosine-3',5'-bis(diphosphate) 3'-pyrophosphohydrolase